jgi:hypothetical protein
MAQPNQGVFTKTRPEVDVAGAEEVAVVQGDFGANAPTEPTFVATEQAFWEAFLPEITVCGRKIRLGPDTPPLPTVLADLLLAEDEQYQQLLKFEQWVETVATPAQVAQMLAQFRNLIAG